MKKRLLIAFGTRPEAIKMAPLIKELEKNSADFLTKVCITGQHKEMMSQVLTFFKIQPDYNLNVMLDNQDLYDITTRILLGTREVIKSFIPDYLIVHGDTSTTFASALSAFYQKVDVVHVEAGLRTNNLYSPFPEEANRKLTSHIAKYHFAPTEVARENLLKENIPDENIFVVGNPVIDAMLMTSEAFETSTLLQERCQKTIETAGYKISKRPYILVTGHRRENFGHGFLEICKGLESVALAHPEVDIVYPVHLNPNVRKPVFEILQGLENVFLVDPLEYEPFIYLMKHCFFILTDSGGIQEEAPSLQKFVLLMRDTTERPESVEVGSVRLIGANAEKIEKHVTEIIKNPALLDKMKTIQNPYGDGTSSKQIIEVLKNAK